MEEYKNACRLCLRKTRGALSELFKCRDAGESYASQLMLWFRIELTDHDQWPTKACKECVRLIVELGLFQTRIVASQDQLSQLSVSIALKNEEVEVLMQEISYEEEVSPVKEEMEQIPESSHSDDDSLIKAEVNTRRTRSKTLQNDSVPKPVKVPVDQQKLAEERLVQEQLMRDMKLLHCHVCKESLDTFKDLQKHMLQTHNITNAYIQCCKRKFGRAYAHNHMKYHQDKDAFKCWDCNRSFLSHSKLERHRLRCHFKPEDAQFSCSQCDKVFADKWAHKSHELTHVPNEERPFKCDQCPFSGFTNAILLLHQKNTHDTEVKHICELCGKAYPNKYRINQHMKRAHTDQLPSDTSTEKSEEVEILMMETQSSDCESGTVKREEVEGVNDSINDIAEDSQYGPSNAKKRIIQSKRNRSRMVLLKEDRTVDKITLEEERLVQEQQMRDMKVLHCHECGQINETFRDLQVHMRHTHNINSAFIFCCDRKFGRAYAHNHMKYHQDKDAFKCLECNKTFLSQHKLNSHKLRAHLTPEMARFTCQHCEKGFVDKYDFKSHLATHVPAEEREFKCDQCPFSCNTNYFLLQHQKNKHTEEKEFICEVCGKGYASKYHLNGHMRAAHEEKHAEQCDLCLKYFFNIRTHKMRVHVDQEKITCEQCPYQCTKINMRLHVAKHHTQQEMLACDICGNMYKTKRSLKEHVNGHLGIRIPCDFCEVTSTSSGNHHNHMKMKHAEEYAQRKEQNRAIKNTQAKVKNARGK